MNILHQLLKIFVTATPAQPQPSDRPVTVPKPRPKRVLWKVLLAMLSPESDGNTVPGQGRLKPYPPMPGVVPTGVDVKSLTAMDSTPYDAFISPQWAFQGMPLENSFPGYPYLAQLAQLPEYRKMSGTLADEMTRKWIKLTTVGEGDKAEKIKQLEAALTKHKVRDCFRKMAEHDGLFGRGQIYINLKKPGGAPVTTDEKELALPLIINKAKIKKDSLIGFTVVEPMWMYPGLYNSTQPLADDYYKPSTWYVMGKIVHDSRFVMMISRPVPDILKAVYSFGGVSLSQLARPYIDNWLRTRDSVSDAVHSFSTSGLATNLETLVSPDLTQQGDIIDRAKLFNAMRDNRGLMILDKESEEFFQFNMPLSGLDALQAQSQEQMSAVSNIPLVKLLGITPSGLNASSDGEIRVFYDHVHAMQENMFRDPLKRVLEIIQLDLFEEIDEEITFEFEPLFQLSSLEKSTQRKADADVDAALIDAGVISTEEARDRLIADPESPYPTLKDNDDADPTDEDDEAEEGDNPDSADTKGAAA